VGPLRDRIHVELFQRAQKHLIFALISPSHPEKMKKKKYTQESERHVYVEEKGGDDVMIF
jgi:hypothetical protein